MRFLLYAGIGMCLALAAPWTAAGAHADPATATSDRSDGSDGSTKPASAAADPADLSRLALALERVIVFKDGYGLFVKTATAVADEAGRVFTETVPDGAVLGCFWAVSEDTPVRSMRAEWVETVEDRVSDVTCLNPRELLRANLGRAVTLEFHDRMELSCTLAELLERRADSSASPSPDGSVLIRDDLDPGFSPGPAISGGSPPNPMSSRALSSRFQVLSSSSAAPPTAGVTRSEEGTPQGGEFVVVNCGDGTQRVLPVSEIRRIRSVEALKTRMARHETVTTRAKRLTMDLGPEAAGRAVSLRLLYFTEGVRWIPTYRLEGDLESSGDLTLQGEILNEVEPIENAALDLIVGVPSFRFKNSPSPLTLERTLRQALQSAQPQQMYMNNAMMSQFANGANNFDQSPAALVQDSGPETAPDLAPSLRTEGAMDLFAYSLERFSLGKGGRAGVRLWESSVEIKHLYTLDLALSRREGGSLLVNSSEAMPSDGASPLRFNQNRVWHQLDLVNNSTLPWTTGAAFLLRKGLPLGQDILTYTSPGGRALIPVTIAVDVRAVYEEEELERNPKAYHWNGYDYALVRQRGSITLTNGRKEAIAIRPRVGLGGKIDKASDDGQIRVSAFNAGDWHYSDPGVMNSHGSVEWSLTLAPGESKTLTFEYSSYIR